MRQVISTAVVAVIVGALAGATMSAVAQAPAEQAITPAAGINAATVDGRSAVGYTNRKQVRRGKLVATNRQGELPSNIVRPFWGYIKNTPVGFADGVDNEGLTGISVTTHAASFNLTTGGVHTVDVACPTGNVIGGGFYDVNAPNGSGLKSSYPFNTTTWRLHIYVVSPPETGTAYAICLDSQPATLVARLTPAAKNPTGNK